MLTIGAKCNHVVLSGVSVKTVHEIKFLGLRVTSAGRFLPWRDEFTRSMYGIKGRLTNAGLGHLPVALIKGLCVRVVPAILYGCKIWAMRWLDDVISGS